MDLIESNMTLDDYGDKRKMRRDNKLSSFNRPVALGQ